MPTLPNAINNSVDTLGWSHKVVGPNRRRINSKLYSIWHSEVEAKIKAKGWSWKKDPSANIYAEFLTECIGIGTFPVGAQMLCSQPKDEANGAYHKALNELMLDCFKKVRESTQTKKHAAA